MKKNVLMYLSLAGFSAIAFAFTGKTSEVKDGAYKANEKASTIGWLAKKVTGQHNGTVVITSGDFNFKGGNITTANFEVDMTSIKCLDITDEGTNAKLVNHLKSDDFFFVEKFPLANFKFKSSTKEGDQFVVTGDLTIKGKTNPVSFPVSLSQEGDKIRVKGEMIFDRSLYDVQYRSKSFFDPATLGNKLIYDEVNLTLDIVAETR